jgi:NTE family protein
MAEPLMTANDFLQDPQVVSTIQSLKDWLSANKKQIIVSDVTDEKGNQYVDLVQEGGGVLGIALVGYTYVLEHMGIRFFSMAGTSAGSINTMLLACSGNKEDEKSSRIVENIAGLDMFSFVDGQPGNFVFNRFIKRFISNMLMGKKPFRRIVNLFKTILLLLLVFALASLVLSFINTSISRWLGISSLAFFLVLVILVWIAIVRFRKFAKNGYGLNEGKVFHNWIRDTISSCHIQNDPKEKNIQNFADFSFHFMRIPPGLKVKPDPRRTNNLAPQMPLVTLITCDIIAERKIEFTRMWDLYWKNPEDVHPGDFVRASMSIPVFFQTYTLKNIRQKSSIEKWKEHLNWENVKGMIPDSVQFIDGGTLSNFPINVFYNPNYPVPRMPTFGVRLQDGILDTANRDNGTFGGYIASLFSTLRFNYDRDFITKNRAYTLGVKNINVQEYNWLNFFMKNEDKIKLFRAGVNAACEFLKNFDWEHYKTERLKNFEMQVERFENPNNMEVFPYSQVREVKLVK